MKQMRSRFRLVTLLLVCAFLLTLVLCTGRALKAADIDLSSPPDPKSVIDSILPESTVSPEASPAEDPVPSPSGMLPEQSAAPGTDILPVSEYDITGL